MKALVYSLSGEVPVDSSTHSFQSESENLTESQKIPAENEEMLQTFRDISGCDRASAIRFLEAFGYDVETAVSAYLEAPEKLVVRYRFIVKTKEQRAINCFTTYIFFIYFKET